MVCAEDCMYGGGRNKLLPMIVRFISTRVLEDIKALYDESPHSHDVDDIHVLGTRLRAKSGARRYTLHCDSSAF